MSRISCKMMQQSKTLEEECGQIPKDDCEITQDIKLRPLEFDLLVRVPNSWQEREEYYPKLSIEYNHGKDLGSLCFDDNEYDTIAEVPTTPLLPTKNFNYTPVMIGVGTALMLGLTLYLTRMVYRLDQRDLGRYRDSLKKSN